MPLCNLRQELIGFQVAVQSACFVSGMVLEQDDWSRLQSHPLCSTRLTNRCARIGLLLP